MAPITDNLKTIKGQLKSAAEKAHRCVDDITLLAVSKEKPAQAIREAYLAGQHHFGENYLQEALDKINALSDLTIVWHFIGAIQSNKTQALAKQFDWIHTLDRVKVAEKLNRHRCDNPTPLNVCIQVNLDNEPNKSGVAPDECLALAKAIEQLPNLRLRGLMTLPKACDNFESQYLSFQRLTHLQSLISSHLSTPLDTLSMGMSSDFCAAIHAGSTLLRIGQAIFGERP